mmetsp:Transcript_889/g.2915  ORF Transcript_889/g.2915 Transcript_889/m.2915 type:complete len:253 (+) Transcript_889:345-1103(+)
MICRHRLLFDPPPTTASSVGGDKPSSDMRFSPPSSAYVAPSIAALYTTPGVHSDPGLRPVNVPIACGQFGERSPTRYGKKRTPPLPGGTLFASSASSSCDLPPPNACLASPTTRVQFMEHRSGKYPPVASQNGWIAAVGSGTVSALYPNSVPEVPKETTSRPSFTHPAPRALIMLSPLPTETGMPAGRPKNAPASGVTLPHSTSGGRSFGSVSKNRASTASHFASSISLASMSMTPIPLASPLSMCISPVMK